MVMALRGGGIIVKSEIRISKFEKKLKPK